MSICSTSFPSCDNKGEIPCLFRDTVLPVHEMACSHQLTFRMFSRDKQIRKYWPTFEDLSAFRKRLGDLVYRTAWSAVELEGKGYVAFPGLKKRDLGHPFPCGPCILRCEPAGTTVNFASPT